MVDHGYLKKEVMDYLIETANAAKKLVMEKAKAEGWKKLDDVNLPPWRRLAEGLVNLDRLYGDVERWLEVEKGEGQKTEEMEWRDLIGLL